MDKPDHKSQKRRIRHEAGSNVDKQKTKSNVQRDIFEYVSNEHIVSEHKKKAHKIAEVIAAGGITREQKAVLVSAWAKHMKAVIKAEGLSLAT